MSAYRLEAVSVNHNTSRYMELMLRSLLARHSADLDLSVTLYDNASDDGVGELTAFAAEHQIPFIQSGFTTNTPLNSHGEVLSHFVLTHPNCTHYLFLDADVVFLEDNTIDQMLAELEGTTNAFGITPRMSWDGEEEIPAEHRLANPDIIDARLHPACALVKNTRIFRSVVEEVGLSCAKMLWSDREEYLDTFKLMTKVMRTHEQRHLISSRMVLHFFCVSYVWEATKHWDEAKAGLRDSLLQQFRQESDSLTRNR